MPDDTAIFKECREWFLKHVDLFEHVTREDIEAIRQKSVTLLRFPPCMDVLRRKSKTLLRIF